MHRRTEEEAELLRYYNEMDQNSRQLLISLARRFADADRFVASDAKATVTNRVPVRH